MRRLLALCFILIFLCSCNKNDDVHNITSVNSLPSSKSATQNTVKENILLSETTASEITTVKIETNPDDPYSVFIKEWYEEIYEAQKGEGAEYFSEFDKHALDVYYFIYDIDGNGVDELILGDWKSVTNKVEDHSAPQEIMISRIYTIENGEAVKQFSFWWSDDFLWETVLLSNGLIRQSTGFEDYPSYVYFCLENGKLELKYGIYYTEDRYGNRSYSYVDEGENGKIIDEEITKEEFERLRDEANGDAAVVEINWKRIDEYGK